MSQALGVHSGLSFSTYQDNAAAIRWRLIAANGRTLGISARSFDDAALAYADLADVREQAAELVANLIHPTSGIGWFWTANNGSGSAVAQGSRSYERRATCVLGFTRFQRTLAAIDLDQPNLPLT